MQNGVTFWTEGGQSAGMGHLSRCVNIARSLEVHDLPMHFLVNNDRAVIERLNQEALFHIVYPVSGRHPERLTNGVVVIDTKHDVGPQVRALKAEGRKVVLIDNSSSDEADAIVMPTPVYRGQAKERLYSGSDYLIIGQGFRRARAAGRPAHASPLRVLVTMGGADPYNLTETVLKALWTVEGIEVMTVIGPAFRMTGSMEEFIRRGGGRNRFLFSVKDMAPVMRDAHLAVTAVGTTVFELAYMGVPSLLIGNYESDADDLEMIEGLGISKSLGHYSRVDGRSIAEAVERFRDDPAAWAEMSTKAGGLTDGEGAARTASIITALTGHENLKSGAL